ncbi:MAG: hypothetical protein EOO46_25490 [Flavobacterium sp.]|nr:MAG: hypothetical protein EOO46_25490 [Flavobacterium sp.]
MKQRELIFTVKTEFDKIIETGEIKYTKTRFIKTNPKLSPKLRQKIGAKAVGLLKKNRSKNAIDIVMQELVSKGVKISIPNIVKAAEGRISERTVKKYWLEILDKHLAKNIEPNIETGMKKETSTEQQITSQDVPMNFQQFKKENFEKLLFSNNQINVEYEKYLSDFSKKTANAKD